MAASLLSLVCRSAAPALLIMLLPLEVRAGARIAELFPDHADSARRSTRMTPSVNLQIGGGITMDEQASGIAPSIGVTLEAAEWSHISAFARVEHATSEESGDALFFQVIGRAELTLIEGGLRWNESTGTTRMFFEAAGGTGLVHATITVLPGPIVFSDDASPGVLEFGIGGAWQPRRSRIGLFGETRMAWFFHERSTSSPFIPLRAGVQLGWSH